MKKAATSRPPPSRDRIVTKPEVLVMFGKISSPTLYRWIKDGKFPRQIRIGPNRTGFLQSELDAHMEHLRDERDAQRDTEVA